jgi:hypothetical protein
MSSRDDELREMMRGALENEKVPDFESSWRRAQARAEDRRGSDARSPWRWALGPVVAVGAAACVALLVIALGPTEQVTSEEPGLIALADAGAPEFDTAALADLETPTVPQSPLSDFDSAGGEPVAAAETDSGETRPGYGLYEAGTDFLLTMEIPAWDQAGERNVL